MESPSRTPHERFRAARGQAQRGPRGHDRSIEVLHHSRGRAELQLAFGSKDRPLILHLGRAEKTTGTRMYRSHLLALQLAETLPSQLS